MQTWICGLGRYSPTFIASHQDKQEDDVISADANSSQVSMATRAFKMDNVRIAGGLPFGGSEIADYDKHVHVPTDDPLLALLSHRQSPVSSHSTDEQKLAWLRSQLIGENHEFVTPFGKRHLIYADHAASGRSLFFIEDFIMRHVLPCYGNTHTDDSYVGSRTSNMVKQAGEYIKRQLGGTGEDVLMMCGWGCTGAIKRLQEVIGVAVPSVLRATIIDTMLTCKGDEEERWLVFVGPYEHHSNLLSWRQSLAEVVEIPMDEDGCIDTRALEAKLKAPQYSKRRWKMGAFSATSNVTGVLTDTRALACLLHRHGAFACFDFAAGLHIVKLNMGTE